MIGKNVEIKAKLNDRVGMESLAVEFADSGPAVIEQKDVFFTSSSGRLKLRKFSDEEGELIHYHRPNTTEPVVSDYTVVETLQPDLLAEVLADAVGVIGIVSKVRTVYLIGQTRVHFDEVEKLGRFVELEVVLEESQTVEQGKEIAHSIMQKLKIREEDLIETAYIDMLPRND